METYEWVAFGWIVFTTVYMGTMCFIINFTKDFLTFFGMRIPFAIITVGGMFIIIKEYLV